MRKRYTRSDRDELIRAVTRRREAVGVAAARLGVTASTAYRWVRACSSGEARAPTQATSTPSFVELVPARRITARLVVRVGAAEVEVGTDFDPVLLRAVVAALAGDLP